MYEMLSGLPPFYSKNIHEMYQRVRIQSKIFDYSRCYYIKRVYIHLILLDLIEPAGIPCIFLSGCAKSFDWIIESGSDCSFWRRSSKEPPFLCEN